MSSEVGKPETVSAGGSKIMAKKATKTTKKNGGERGPTTTVQLRQEATGYLRKLEEEFEEELGIKLQPAQVVLIALKNEVARRKES